MFDSLTSLRVVRWSVRDDRPLSGTTPADLVSQLAHRVFGPLHRDRVRAMLDYHGLADRPADSITVVANRHHISDRTMTTWAQTLRTAGARLPISVDLVNEIGRHSSQGDDHVGRTRVAKTFGLRPPPAPVKPTPTPPPRLAREDHAAGIATIRVLAAAGPQTLSSIQSAITRTRRTPPRLPTEVQLAAALLALGATVDEQDRWHPPSDQWTPAQYRRLMAAADGRTLTRSAMVAKLVEAGYSLTYAEQRAIDTHPLIRRIGPNTYRLIGDDIGTDR